MAEVALLPAVQRFISREHALFRDGKTVPATTATRQSLFNPATGDVLSSAAEAGPKDVDAAVTSAATAFADGRWAKLRPADRERVLMKLSELLAAHAEELAQIETLNQGKSIGIARMIDVGTSVEYVRYMAGWATKIEGQTLDVSIGLPPGKQHFAYTRREPAGVVAAIVPWNFPLMIALWKVAPALACGCSVVLKPSEETPLSALRVAELATEAGVPDGVFNVVTGNGATTGAALVKHSQVTKISFTGSTSVGKEIGRAALENMTRFSLELGGKNPLVVFADANLEAAINGIVVGGLFNQGQVCASASRIYVQRGIYQRVVDAVSGAMSGMAVGAGLDELAQVNPLVSARHQRNVLQAIARAKSEGARVAAGGEAPDRAGFYVKPTLLLEVGDDSATVREEVFGPVLSVHRFDDEDEVVRRVNASRYGLAASVWTRDLERAMTLVPRIQAGTVWVNNHVPVDANLPFGGYKQSGFGRELGKSAIEGFTELKSVCISY